MGGPGGREGPEGPEGDERLGSSGRFNRFWRVGKSIKFGRFKCRAQGGWSKRYQLDMFLFSAFEVRKFMKVMKVRKI